MSIPILTRIILDLGPEGSDYLIEREVRWIADPTDPDDQRAIWRLAAMALGATEEEAMTAILICSTTEIGSLEWTLRTGGGLSEWWRKVEGADVMEASAALCERVWGPQ